MFGYGAAIERTACTYSSSELCMVMTHSTFSNPMVWVAMDSKQWAKYSKFVLWKGVTTETM
jgi:hypothetical protein